MALPNLELARPNERWGGFVFFDDPAFRVDERDLIAAPLSLEESGCIHCFPFAHPGFKQFDTLADFSSSIKGRAPARSPKQLPSSAELMGAYSVEDGRQRILATAINYTHKGSGAPFGDPDIWISFDRFESQPLAYGTTEVDAALGRKALPAKKLMLNDLPAVLLEYTSPAKLPRELRHRSAVSWFETDGGFWTVQARDINVEQLVAIATSLEPY